MRVIYDAWGKAWLMPDDPAPYDPHTDMFMAELLERQNLARWSQSESAWDRTLTPVVSGAYEVLNLTSEDIVGDTYDTERGVWSPGVPGYYNLKVYLSFALSDPLTTQLTKVEFAYRSYDASGNVGTWEPLGAILAPLTNVGAPTYLPEAVVSGADTVGLTQGQGIQFGYVAFMGANITWFDSFYARVVMEKVADHYTEASGCCE